MKIIVSIIVGILSIIFCYKVVKKAENVYEKIMYILFFCVYFIFVIIYELDRYDIPTRFGWATNVNTQNWLAFLSNYLSSIISTAISVLVLVLVTNYELEKNFEISKKRDEENIRLQNLPLLKLDCKEKNDRNIEFKNLDTNIKDGEIQQINIGIKNIGQNTIRKSCIKIKSDVLEKEYLYELGSQSSIEKNQEIRMQFLLNLLVNATYKFELVVYFQDLLSNNYEQKFLLEYKLFPLKNENGCLYKYKFITEEEKIIDKFPVV